MRLIGHLKTEQEAFQFQKFCHQQQIELILEKGAPGQVQIWVVDEDDAEEAEQFLESYKKDPASPKFYLLNEVVLDHKEYDTSQPHVVQKNPRLPLLTWVWVLFSVICYFIQMGQEVALAKQQGSILMETALTPIEENFFYDVPEGFSKLEAFVKEHQLRNEQDLKNLSASDKKSWLLLQRTAYFHGFLDMLSDATYRQSYSHEHMVLAQKIRQGELYRLLTPVFLHGSILHILFNMIWLFVLLKQVEIKLGILKTILLVFLCAAFSNTCQYLVSGPFFVGVSGVIVGLAAFIWIRQKKAPWEGYILSKPLLFFLMIYVLALVVLSIGVFVFNLSSQQNWAFGVANTAHVAGGLAGLCLGLSSFFRRR